MKQRRAGANAETVGGNELDHLGLRLQNVRLLQNTTQSTLAKLLGISQTALSHLERRDDILLSTLNAYVEALGGQLHVAATFTNAEAVPLVGDSRWHLREEPSASPEQNDRDQLSLPHILGPAQLPPSRDVILSGSVSACASWRIPVVMGYAPGCFRGMKQDAVPGMSINGGQASV